MVEDYDGQLTRLRGEIQSERWLRNAQRHAASMWELFQRRIEELTAELLRWEETIPELQRLDDEITTAENLARELDRRRQELWPSRQGGLVLLAVGALLCLALAGLLPSHPWWLWGMTALLAVVFIGVCVATGNERSSLALRHASVLQQLGELYARKRALIDRARHGHGHRPH